MLRILRALAFAGAFIVGYAEHARAHDIYTGLQQDGSRGASSPCCGDKDCEGVEWSGVQIHPDGSASLYSRRHGVSVFVPAEKIVPVALPPGADGRVYAAHWCGAKRTVAYSPYGSNAQPEIAQPTAEQPDPAFVTFCAFIAPGGA